MTDDNTDESRGIRERAGRTKESLASIIGSADTEVRNKLSNAVTVANAKSEGLRNQLDELSARTSDAAKPVLNSVKDHIKENDLEVTISGNTIHVEGDEAGLKKVDADLREAFNNRDVHVEYDRDEGVNIKVDDSEGAAAST